MRRVIHAYAHARKVIRRLLPGEPDPTEAGPPPGKRQRQSRTRYVRGQGFALVPPAGERLGPAVITSHPGIVAQATRACQAPELPLPGRHRPAGGRAAPMLRSGRIRASTPPDAILCQARRGASAGRRDRLRPSAWHSQAVTRRLSRLGDGWQPDLDYLEEPVKFVWSDFG
jgi:hypothetical protein